MADGKVIIETGLDSKGIEQGLSKMGSLIKTGLGAATAVIGATITALIKAGTAVTKFGSDFETSLGKASTLFGDANVNTSDLSSKILDLSSSSGVAADAIGNSLYNALSAGIPATDDMGAAMEYMESCTKLAKAGFTDVDTVVTSTAKVLNAYKMDVNETGNVHKILMQVQNKGITTVGELGASLAQVTPTAAAMNVSFEQVGAALATMTAQGTPTAQATTQLNSLFAELGKQGTVASKSLEKATEGTKYAGKGFSELMAEGVPLNEILNLMGATADMSDQSLIDMFGSIEAGNAALAMSGQNAQQYADNLAAMATETDVVGDAYEKVTDTFQAKSQIFIEGAKNLGIAIYQGMEEPLKGAAEAGIGYVDDLTNTFQNGGLTGLVEEAGNIFADIVTKAAEQAPKVVDAAVSLIESFVKGIVDNHEKLIKAAANIARTLADGLVKLLPVELKRPVKEAIDSIVKLFQGNNFKNAVKSFETVFKNLGRVVKGMASTLFTPLIKVLDATFGAISKLTPVIIAGTVAFGEYQIVKKVTGFIKGYQAVLVTLTAMEQANALQLAASTGALTLKEFAVGKLTGKITRATAATTLWNAVMDANPIGLLVVAIGALTAGLVGVIASKKDLISQTEIENQKLSEEARAIREAQKARQETIDGINAESEHYQSLWKELQTLVDENGNVKQGYEERAAFITSTLSEALGIEMDLVDGQITNYGELRDSIDQLIEKKKAEAIVNAYQENYTEALKGQAEAQSQLTQKYNESQNAQDKLSKAQAAYNDFLDNGNTIGSESARKQSELLTAIAEAENGVKSSTKAYEDAKTKADEYNTTIANVESLQGAAASSSDNLSAEVLKTVNGFKNARFATDQELIEQRNTMFSRYQEMEAAAKEGGSGITQAAVTEAQAMYYLSEAEYAKMAGMAEAEIQSWVDKANEVLGASNTPEVAQQKAAETHEAYSTELVNSSPEVTQAAETLPESANQALESADTTTAATGMGVETGDAAAASYAAQGEKVAAAASTVPESANSGMASSDVTSVPTSMGEEAGQALTDALNRFCDMVSQAASNLTNAGNMGIQNADMSTTSTNAASNAITAMIGAFDNGILQVQEAAARLGNALNVGFQNAGVRMSAAGMASQVASAMVNAVNGYYGAMLAAGSGLGRAVANGLRTANLSGSAAAIASSACAAFTGTINGRVGAALIAGTNLGRAVGNGLRAANIIVTATTLATQMTTTFLRIITSSTTQAQSAGRTLASAVGTGMQSAGLKTTANTVGSDAVTGLVGGIDNNKNKANEAGESLAKEAKNGLSGYGLYSKGHSTGSDFVSGFADGISQNSYRAKAQAQAMARAAADAANAELGINSPSRVGHWIGEMFDRGTADGILDNIDLVEDAGSKLSESLLDKVDIQAAAQKMRLAVETESARIGILVSSKVNVSSLADKKESAPITQTVNINQPVKSPIETAREIRRVGRELAFG